MKFEQVLFNRLRAMSAYWKDIAWQASGNSLAQIVGVAGIPILTRLYTPEEFAIQGLFIQLVTLLAPVVTWRYEFFVQLPKHDEDSRAILRLAFFLGAIALIVLTPAFWWSREAISYCLGNSLVAPWLALAPLSAVLISWATAAQNNAQRYRDFKNSGASELVAKLTYVFTAIVCAFFYFGVIGLVATTAAAAMGKSVYLYFRRKTLSINFTKGEVENAVSVMKRYRRLATSTVLSHLLSTCAIALPQVAVAHMYGADVQGQFALVLATIYLPSGLLGAAIGQVYYQRASQLWSDGGSVYELWRHTALKLLLIGAPVYAIVALSSKFAYPLVFGDQWYIAGEFAAWMAIAAFGSFLSSPMDRTFMVVGAWKYTILWSIYRLASTTFVVWLAWSKGFSASEFIKALVIQMLLAYAIDFWSSFQFSQGRLGVFSNQKMETK